jgi:hypothetical protein
MDSLHLREATHIQYGFSRAVFIAAMRGLEKYLYAKERKDDSFLTTD